MAKRKFHQRNQQKKVNNNVEEPHNVSSDCYCIKPDSQMDKPFLKSHFPDGQINWKKLVKILNKDWHHLQATSRRESFDTADYVEDLWDINGNIDTLIAIANKA